MKTYTKIRPLGARPGLGTFESFWSGKYKSLEEAIGANDLVVVDFVKDAEGTIYFELYHTKDPNAKRHYELEVQNFLPVFGVDTFDDDAAQRMAHKMIDIFA